MAHLSPEEASRLKDQGIQVVGQSPAVQIAADRAIGRLQAEHLQAKGYSRIVAVLPRSKREQINAPHREAGVLEYSRLHNLDVLPTLKIDLNSEEAVRAVRTLPAGRVGLACYNDEVALAMLGAARHVGLSVPGAVGVIGVDNSVIARASTPTITSVNMNLDLNVRELISHIVSGQDLQVPDGELDEYLRGLEVVPGDTTGR
ncbi:substrate-binding domain-containing protein [Paenarthrobacter histidinolovorans]|uniref:substrate-binding domain-containing protein n=1 Tax=Paenarthrobacter histidinolovorans TaxID=43664 RepID=UPI001E603605|nr:substrate-binding domain-containing protein [Paenarthrobacter histidinolovorans]